MNYRNLFKHQQEEPQSLHINCQQQFAMIFQTLQFVISKLEQIYQWQQEESRLKKKKSLLKVFDKNIGTMPNVKIEGLQVPIFDQFSKITNKLEIYKTTLPSPKQEEAHQSSTWTQNTSQQLTNHNQQLSTLSHQLSQQSNRIQSIESDLLQLISLYKDLL